jgi:hypothetical protein
MIPRVGQDCDRCPPEVIMCGSDACWPALRRAPMVSSGREEYPRGLRSLSGRPIRIGSAGPGAVRYGSVARGVHPGAKWSIRDRRRAQELIDQARYTGPRRQVGSA